MIRLFDSAREAGGRDPLDAELPAPAPLPVDWTFLLRTRAALGLAPITAPAIVLVPIGMLLGPSALNVLSPNVLAHLDTVISVALAALGVFVGLALDLRRVADRRLFAAASLEAAVTVTIVGAALVLLLVLWHPRLDHAPLLVALVIGVAAAASSAGTVDASADERSLNATRIADLDDVVPILVGALLLAAAWRPTAGGMLWLTLVSAVAGLGIGVAGWLLFERAHGPAERGLFVLGSVVLLGGIASYMALSPLFVGLVAGLFWTYTPGRADQVIRGDLQKLQHPLVVVLLLAAGASIRLDTLALWLIGPFVVFRLAGKLAGGWVASRVATGLTPVDLGALLIPAGLLGLAYALLFWQSTGSPTAQAVLTAIALGTLANEVIAMLVVPHTADTAPQVES